VFWKVGQTTAQPANRLVMGILRESGAGEVEKFTWGCAVAGRRQNRTIFRWRNLAQEFGEIPFLRSDNPLRMLKFRL
jgi:hypothetical protein